MANPNNNDPINLDIKALNDANIKIKDIISNVGNVQSNFDKVNEEIEEFNSLTSDLNEALKIQTKEVKDIAIEFEKYYELKLKLDKANKDELKFQQSYKTNIEKINDLEKDKVKNIIEEGVDARRNLGEQLSKSKKAQNELNAAIAKGGAFTGNIDDLRNKAIVAAKNLQEEEEKSLKLSQAISGEWGVLGINLNDIEKSYAAQAIQQRLAQERAEDYKNNHKDQFNTLKQQTTQWQKIQSAASFYEKRLKAIGILDWGNKQLAAVGISLSAIIDNLLDYDKMLTNTAKTLGISKDGAKDLAKEYDDISFNTEDINKNANTALMTTRAQFEAQSQLNEALGTAGLFTAKSRIDQAVLTKQMGLSAQEAANLYKFGSLNQQTAEDVQKIVAQEVIDSGKQNKNKLDYKKVLQDVSKVEGQLAAQYQNNPVLIAKAVAQTKQLGLELSQVTKISDSLLNFQSSIQNELEAELLIGKALNFERARELALRGDSVGAAKELVDQVGTLEDFQQLNVLQQRSLAQAIGMSADELSNSLKQQQLLANTGFESQQAFEEAARNADTVAEKEALRAKLLQSTNADQLIANAQQISNQEKITEAVNKLKDSLAALLSGPLGGIIDGFANIVSSAETLKGLFAAISTIIVGNMLKGIASLSIEIAKMILPTSQIAAASIATMSAWTLGLGVAAIIGGLIAGVSAINSATKSNISVRQASGGGINSIPSQNNISTPSQNQQQNSNTEITVNFGGNTYAKINTQNNKSQTSYA
jgi:hypothetical protein